MNRSEVITLTAERIGMELDRVEEVVTALFDITTEALVAGEPVKFRRFGNLEPRLRAGHVKPNPKTREPMEIPDRVSVAFMPSDILKARLNSEMEG